MKELLINNIDIYSIKTRFANCCYNDVKYWSYLEEQIELKKHQYTYSADGLTIKLYDRVRIIPTYLTIEIISLENDVKKFIMNTSISKMIWYYFAIYSIPSIIKIFIDPRVPLTISLLPLLLLTVFLIYSYLYETKKQIQFVRGLFADKIIKSP